MGLSVRRRIDPETAESLKQRSDNSRWHVTAGDRLLLDVLDGHADVITSNLRGLTSGMKSQGRSLGNRWLPRAVSTVVKLGPAVTGLFIKLLRPVLIYILRVEVQQ